MKKLLVIGTALFVFSAPAAYAEEAADTTQKQEFRGQRMFEKSDVNDDGMISKEEFMAEHEKRFAESDTNDDGNISKEEFIAKGKEMHEKMNEYRAKRKAEAEARMKMKDAPAAE